METTYKFTAYNSPVVYGYGTQTEADLFLSWLNKAREINLYQVEIAELTEAQAETLAINLRDNLADL